MSYHWSDFNATKHRQLYKRLYALDNNLKIDTYLDIYDKKELLNIISGFSLGDSAKEGFFYMVARYLQIHDTDNIYIKKYQTIAYETRRDRAYKKGNNSLDTKAEIESHKPIEYFYSLLNRYNINDFKKIVAHYPYFLVSLLIYQAPLRSNFYLTAKFKEIQDEEEIKTLEDFNYLLIKNINDDDPKMYYRIFSDKVSDTLYYNTKPELSIIEITDKKLKDIIIASYKNFPRCHLFETVKKKPFENGFLLNYLKKFTKLEQININIVRSVFVSSYYRNKNHTNNDKVKLSHMMRHSIATANNTYLKIIKDADVIVPKDVLENNELIQLKTDHDDLKYIHDELKTNYDNLLLKFNNIKSLVSDDFQLSKARESSLIKEDILINDDVVEQSNTVNKDNKPHNKNRRDMVYLANKGKILKISTIFKYGILYDEVNKKFY